MKKKKLLRFSASLSLIVVTSYLILDLLISSILYVTYKSGQEKFFLENFPVAVRNFFYDSPIIISKPEANLKIENPSFFALLSKFVPEYICIVQNDKKLADITDPEKFKKILVDHKNSGGKLIIALGGSTTASSQIENWPTPLEKLVNKSNYMVINAGHNAFTSYQENILLFKVLLPLIDPIYPDIVISLTGVNDVSRGFSSILNVKRFDLNGLFKTLHVNGNFLVNDIRHWQQRDLRSNLAKKIGHSRLVRTVMPSMSQFMISSKTPIVSPKSLIEGYGSIGKNNLSRICNLYIKASWSAGPYYPLELTRRKIDGIEVFDKYSNAIYDKLPLETEEFSEKLTKCSKERYLQLFEKKNYSNNLIEEDKILQESLGNHLRTFHSLKAKGVKYYVFLQPVSYGMKSPIKDIPDINYILIHWHMQNQLRGHDYIVDMHHIFDRLEDIVKDPPYNEYFFSINKQLLTEFDGDPFTIDNIHYTADFSELIADTIFKRILR